MKETIIQLTSRCSLTELAFKISDRCVKIQACGEGWNYAIYDELLKELDRGVWHNPETPIEEVARIICMELSNGAERGYSPATCKTVRLTDKRIPVGYETLGKFEE